jgi:hypothetical protein
VLPPLRAKNRRYPLLFQSLLPVVTHHCWLSQHCPTHRRPPPHRMSFLHHRLKRPDDVETRWNYLETTRKTMSYFSHHYLLRLRLIRLPCTLPLHRQHHLQQQSLMLPRRQHPGRTYQPRLSWMRLRLLADAPTLPTLPDSLLNVAPSPARAAMEARPIPVPAAPASSAAPSPPASPSSNTPSSPPPPRAPNQEGWDLCMKCRRHYHHKMYRHCWFCNFK